MINEIKDCRIAGVVPNAEFHMADPRMCQGLLEGNTLAVLEPGNHHADAEV